MAYTQSDIDTLKAAIATGALKVEFGSGAERRGVTYRSLQEMRETLAEMLAEVSPGNAQPMRTVGHFNSGLWPCHDER